MGHLTQVQMLPTYLPVVVKLFDLLWYELMFDQLLNYNQFVFLSVPAITCPNTSDGSTSIMVDQSSVL